MHLRLKLLQKRRTLPSNHEPWGEFWFWSTCRHSKGCPWEASSKRNVFWPISTRRRARLRRPGCRCNAWSISHCALDRGARKVLKKKPDIDEKAAVQALEYLLAAGYVSKKRLYIENFFRGIFFSVGSIIGAAIVVTILLWGLSLFKNIPFINSISKNIEQTVNK